jgi:ubiquilin
MTAEDMRLIFKGKILKDELTLDEYKITDGLTVHLVKGKSSATTTAETGSTLASGADLSSGGA